MPRSRHAELRAQARAVPRIVDTWLDEFGEEEYVGAGAVTRFFSHRSIRRMEREFGHQFVRHNSRYLRAYKVEAVTDGAILTIGWRNKHLRRC